MSLRCKSLAINKDVNCSDTRWRSHSKNLKMQWVVHFYVQVGSSTLINDSDYLTSQLAIAHEEDSTLYLNYNVINSVVKAGKA